MKTKRNKMKYTILCFLAIALFSCTNNIKSPIDIKSTIKQDNQLRYFVDYFEVEQLTINNKSTHLEIPLYEENNFVTINDTAEYSGKDFKLEKIEIYSPSVHSINQKFFDAEIMFVHQDTSNNYLIISLLVEKGNENIPFSSILSNIPSKTESKTLNLVIDLLELHPQKNNFYYYDGTTLQKPFELAKWIILKQTIGFSSEQLTNLQSKITKSDIKQQKDNTIKVFEN